MRTSFFSSEAAGGPCAVILAGICVLALLPTGIILGTAHPLFDLIAFSHFSLHLFALAAGALGLLALAVDAGWRGAVLLGLCALFFGVIGLDALVPTTARDALTHHIAVPQWWLEAGRIHPIPWHEWSYYPALLQLGYLALMKYGWGELASLYHASFLFLLTASVALFTRARSTSLIGLVAALVTVSIPLSLRVAATPLVDMGLALYTFLALHSLIRWGEGQKPGRALLAGGCALGLALNTKYNALLVTVILLLLFPIVWQQSGQSRRRLITGASIFFGSALLLFTPGLIKNYLWTGNPIYPLYNNHFATTLISPAGMPSVRPLEHRLSIYGEDFPDLLLLPLRILVSGQDGSPQQFDGVLSPILLLAAVPVLMAPRMRWARFLASFSVFYFLFELFYAAMRVRYLLPALGAAAALTAIGFATLTGTHRVRLARPIALGALGVHLLLSFQYSYNLLKKEDTIAFLRGEVSSPEYLGKRIPEFPMIEFMNAELAPDSLTYLLFTGNRFSLYETPVFSSGHYSAGWIFHWLRHSTSAGDLARYFQERGVTHLMTDTARTREAFREVPTPEEQRIWQEFTTRHLQLLHQARGFSLWKVSPQITGVAK